MRRHLRVMLALNAVIWLVVEIVHPDLLRTVTAAAAAIAFVVSIGGRK